MSVDNDRGKNNGWHLKNGNSSPNNSGGEARGAAGGAAGEEEEVGMEEQEEAATVKGEAGEEEKEVVLPPASRKRVRSADSLSNASEPSTDSHGAKRQRVSFFVSSFCRISLCGGSGTGPNCS